MVKAKAIMKADVITVRRDTDIYEAIRTMVQNNITGLPVVNDDRTLAGVITERDVLKLLYNFEDRPGKVEEFMTEQVVYFNQEESLDGIVERFSHNHFRRVPIVDNGRLVGIISRRDIIAYMRGLMQVVRTVSGSFGRGE